METPWPPGPGRWRHPWRAAGSALLAATGAIHLGLYLTGYRTIPTIGWLFLLQVISAFVLAAAVLAPRGRLPAALGAGFALATLGGYLLSAWVGLFGFREVRTAAGLVAGVIEIAAFAVLALVALSPAGEPHHAHSAAHAGGGSHSRAGLLTRLLRDGVPGANWAVSGVSAVALVLLGTALATSGPAAASGGGSHELKTASIGGVTVLTNSRGFTLYWFAADRAGRSECYGSCATYWPPVPGTPVAGPGVTGTLGTIARTGGTRQATYDGRPLYTYVGDSAPGQDRGNNLNLNGGLWHQVTVGG